MNTDLYELSYVVVDDDDDDRMLMRMALERANRPLPVVEFSDGQELIDYLSQDAATHDDQEMHWLVVMDVNMPRMGGLEVVKQLKSNPEWAKLPVLIMSLSDDPDTVTELLDNGANGYVAKPESAGQYTEIFDQFFAPWLASEQDRWPVSAARQ